MYQHLKAFVGLLIMSFSWGCTKNSKIPLQGNFVGSALINRSISKLKFSLSRSADGVASGEWEAEKLIKKGHVTLDQGFLWNIILLRVPEGECKGEFAGKFSVENKNNKVTLRGNLEGAHQCEVEEVNFEVSEQ